MDQAKVKVEIFGNQYHLFADDDPDRIIELARKVDRHMQDIATMNPGMASSKIAILAALNFAAQAAGFEEFCNLFAERSVSLIKLISDELND